MFITGLHVFLELTALLIVFQLGLISSELLTCWRTDRNWLRCIGRCYIELLTSTAFFILLVLSNEHYDFCNVRWVEIGLGG